MNEYKRIGWFSYVGSLLSGRPLHLTTCLVFVGLTQDFVYEIAADGNRVGTYLPSRLKLGLQRVLAPAKAALGIVGRAVGYVAHVIMGRSRAAKLLRWLVAVVAAVVVERMLTEMLKA